MRVLVKVGTSGARDTFELKGAEWADGAVHDDAVREQARGHDKFAKIAARASSSALDLETTDTAGT